MDKESRVQIRMDEEQIRKLRAIARARGQTASDFVRDSVEQHFEQIDWFQIGQLDGENDRWSPPQGFRPGEEPYDAWEAGFSEGNEEVDEDE